MIFDNIFNEICKLSTLNATKAFSQVVQVPIGVSMHEIENNHIKKINELIGPDEVTVNLTLPITGNLSGTSFVLYSKEAAHSICDILLKQNRREATDFNETEISALTEIGNIVIGNFLTSFAHSLQMDMLIHRAATFDCAPFKDIYSKIIATVEKSSQPSLLKISFSFKHIKIKGQVLIFLDEKKVDKIWHKVFHSSSVEGK